MTRKPCLTCRRPMTGPGSHHKLCDPRRDMRSRRETTRRAAVVAQWRETRGNWCPGYNRPGHTSADLTADHLDGVGEGGREDGPLAVLCRSCNSVKGNEQRRAQP